MAEPYKRKTRYPGLKEHERLQKQKEADAKKAAKRKAKASSQAKKPFNPGRSSVADSFRTRGVEGLLKKRMVLDGAERGLDRWGRETIRKRAKVGLGSTQIADEPDY